MTSTSSATVSAALAGDDTALVELIRKHHGQLFRFGVRMCGNRTDADDAVQEALLTLARRPDMHDNPGVIRWMFTVIKNWCLRIVRRARFGANQQLPPAETVASDQPCPETMLREYRVAEMVRDAIAALDRPYKEVVVLRDLEGLSGERVCAALNITEATMKSRLHRGRASLRRALADSMSATEI